MLRGVPIAFLLAVVLAGCASSSPPTSNPPATACDESLWDHVYHPDRLKDPDPAVHHKCLTVTGTVRNVLHEADGDDHIRLHVDAGFEGLLNDKNRSEQQGDLVVEPMCVGTVTQDDAKDACSTFHNQVTIPRIGDHVTVVGVHVLDNQHGWMELHPVTSITVG
ncbi:MAG: hypothetical protein V4510_00290 [bacterium]